VTDMLGLSIAGDSDDEEEADTSLDPMAMSRAMGKDDFSFSQSGAFKLSDFQIRPEGGLTLTSVGEEKSSDLAAHPTELVNSPATPALEVSSINDLDMGVELGSGASGTVFSATHRLTGTRVAVKCVTILEKSKRDQVISELRIMMKHTLGARWLVHLHNAFYEEAKVYTVLEMMDGGSVEDLVKRHAPSGGLHDEAELGRISLQLLSGLNHLHRQLHQVHRDLKPANVMLNSRGDVKISDFGISSQLVDTGAFCETFVGTTCYMSPERLSGEAYSYGADIWAFGLIMLELATGKYPYKASSSYFELLGSIMDDEPPKLSAASGLPDGFGDLVALCIDKEAKLRPSARDLLNHPWIRQFDESGGSSQPGSANGQGGAGFGAEEDGFDRSRSHINLDMSAVLSGMSLRDR